MGLCMWVRHRKGSIWMSFKCEFLFSFSTQPLCVHHRHTWEVPVLFLMSKEDPSVPFVSQTKNLVKVSYIFHFISCKILIQSRVETKRNNNKSLVVISSMFGLFGPFIWIISHNPYNNPESWVFCSFTDR